MVVPMVRIGQPNVGERNVISIAVSMTRDTNLNRR